ncbi:YheT family hydrolase [Inhella gelatinilytica]|uniref:YheT family hydrolase n=1 Tax=Inhella gelatinilytica TaxID=2795030 RepID=UPI001FE2679D|nr:alpha/beta fold hydrolase [Inhella gelatinilytica]
MFARRFEGDPVHFRRERWETPDGDFVDCDWLVSPRGDSESPVLVLFHGLEGHSGSHYAQAFAHWARAQGWAFAVPHFRGCSGELNRAPRAYHSGDHVEIDWMLRQVQAVRSGPCVAVGVSLGGNALLRWAQEAGPDACSRLRALAAVSAPLDLAAAARALERGVNRWVYTRYFLRTMVPKALQKAGQHPGLFDVERVRRVGSVWDFDDHFTAPLHGFANATDYYTRASAAPGLGRIRIPSLVLNARNDPFVPFDSLPRAQDVPNPAVRLWQPDHGGHVGFATGRWPGHLLALPARVGAWLEPHLG